MLSSPGLEFDILSRCRWLAEAMVSENNLGIDIDKVADQARQDIAQVMPAPDQITWFAMERLANKTGLRAVKMEHPGQPVGGASLVWVSPRITPNQMDAKELAGVALAICNPEWLPLINACKLESSARRKPSSP